MSETVLTSPIILDATGQDMLTKLDSIISAINPVAQGVSYDNAGTGMVANNVQSAITELKTGLDNTNSSLTNLSNVVDGCITWRSKIMPDITMQANSTGNASLDLNTLAGYKPIGIVGYTGTGTTGTVMQECYMTSTYKAFVYLRNMTNAQKTVSNVTVNVLYIKDDII